ERGFDHHQAPTPGGKVHPIASSGNNTATAGATSRPAWLSPVPAPKRDWKVTRMPALMARPTKSVRGQPVGTPTTRRTTVAASQDRRTRKTREAVLSSTNPPMSKASIAAPPGRSVYQCDVEPLASSLVLRRLPGTSARAEAAPAIGQVDRSGPDEDPDRAGEGEQSGEQHAEGQTRHGDDEREQSRTAEL